MHMPEWLAKSEHGPLLQGLLAVAWADAKLSSEERHMLGQLAVHLGLEPTEPELSAWLGMRPEPSLIADLVQVG